MKDTLKNKKLYIVSIDLEWPVIASSPEEAMKIAEKEVPKDVYNNDPYYLDYNVKECRGNYIPSNYSETDLTLDGSMQLIDAWRLNND